MGRTLRARIRVGLRIGIVAVLVSATTPSRADASLWCWLFGSDCGGGSTATEQQGSPGRATPEIDPNALASAVALAAGGAAVLRDRVRRRR